MENGQKQLSYAYELGGNNENALSIYRKRVNRITRFDEARVLYKMGKNSKAFEIYCELLKQTAMEYVNPSDREYISPDYIRTQYRHKQRKYAYEVVMCSSCGYPSFCPYPNFFKFYEFMKQEYELQCSPEKYKQVMKFLEEVNEKPEGY